MRLLEERGNYGSSEVMLGACSTSMLVGNKLH